jgi:hypothetical protein
MVHQENENLAIKLPNTLLKQKREVNTPLFYKCFAQYYFVYQLFKNQPNSKVINGTVPFKGIKIAICSVSYRHFYIP